MPYIEGVVGYWQDGKCYHKNCGPGWKGVEVGGTITREDLQEKDENGDEGVYYCDDCKEIIE